MFSELTTKNRKYLRMTTTSSVMSVGLSSSKSARSTVLSSSWLIDRPVAVGEKDRAKKTLPAGFEIRDSGIPGAGLGVFYCGDGGLPIGTHFGPYEGHRTDEEGALESGCSWEIY
ncbi:histone-lysine N-methyltransferase PRDM7-like [Gadus chalcogrammus]|uniref:histone-lysine N-methyltransferase PRDM7-like n=1 Tax=Gadus chalcogrammus TaxID=1042646 RepID=UPI0024C23F20|nr:histone-lysine N-methyltransferase PRDM7-like [Gadus chalcogrammus]